MPALADGRTEVLIAEVDPLARNAITGHLRSANSVTVVGEVVEASGLLRAARLLTTGVIVYGLQASGMDLDVMASTARLLADRPVGILVFSLDTSRHALLAALAAGARGFLAKESGVEQLTPAIGAVAAGQFVVGRDHLGQLLQGQTPSGAMADGAENLTATETEVLRLIAKGYTNREISGALKMAESTVKSHISHVLAKTGARSRAQAVALMYERGHPLC